jgi:hypothetical protein
MDGPLVLVPDFPCPEVFLRLKLNLLTYRITRALEGSMLETIIDHGPPLREEVVVLGGWAFSYERGTPVQEYVQKGIFSLSRKGIFSLSREGIFSLSRKGIFSLPRKGIFAHSPKRDFRSLPKRDFLTPPRRDFLTLRE